VIDGLLPGVYFSREMEMEALIEKRDRGSEEEPLERELANDHRSTPPSISPLWIISAGAK
jgi:hypothetical protein